MDTIKKAADVLSETHPDLAKRLAEAGYGSASKRDLAKEFKGLKKAIDDTDEDAALYHMKRMLQRMEKRLVDDLDWDINAVPVSESQAVRKELGRLDVNERFWDSFYHSGYMSDLKLGIKELDEDEESEEDAFVFMSLADLAGLMGSKKADKLWGEADSWRGTLSGLPKWR